MNRNPLPRGRACESADWLTEFFKYLPPTTGSCGVPTIRVPLTLTLRHSRPHTWYTSPKRGGVVEQVAARQRAPPCMCHVHVRPLTRIPVPARTPAWAQVAGDRVEETIARFLNASAEQSALLNLEGQVCACAWSSVHGACVHGACVCVHCALCVCA